MSHFFRRPDPPPLTTHNIRISCGQGIIMLVCVNKCMVTIHLFNRNLKASPIATQHYFVTDEPLLSELYSETLGWDLELLLQIISNENPLEQIGA